MAKIFQNPFFQVMVLFISSTFLWYIMTDQTKKVKQRTLSLATDGLYYFVIFTIGLNAIFNIKNILIDPFQIILFSSTTSWTAALGSISYLFFKHRNKMDSQNEVIINQTTSYILLLGFMNQLFYYYKYQNIVSVILLITYFLFYLLHNKIKFYWKNESIFIGLAIIHVILLSIFGNVIIYYQIIFYNYQISSLFLLLSFLLFLLRSRILSKQKLQD